MRRCNYPHIVNFTLGSSIYALIENGVVIDIVDTAKLISITGDKKYKGVLVQKLGLATKDIEMTISPELICQLD